MPTYEYACPKCGHAFELFQSMRDEPLKKCPKCKKAGVKRLVGAGAGLIFKGSGFYITDYKNKSAPAGESGGGDSKAPAPPAPASAKADGKTAEAKSPAPAKATESKPTATPAPAPAGGASKASSSARKK